MKRSYSVGFIPTDWCHAEFGNARCQKKRGHDGPHEWSNENSRVAWDVETDFVEMPGHGCEAKGAGVGCLKRRGHDGLHYHEDGMGGGAI